MAAAPPSHLPKDAVKHLHVLSHMGREVVARPCCAFLVVDDPRKFCTL